MSDTTFVSKVTQIATAWMQDLNNFFYRFTGGTPKATPVPGDGFWLWDSVGSAWKTLSFTNLLTYLTGSLTPTNAVNSTNLTGSGSISGTTTGGGSLSVASATVANRTDSGEVTVTANATTGDIFAAAANSILWDDSGGSVTCTIFPNAPKAGMVRELRCNGATKFTAGANLLIEGIPSGTTITLASGALVKVRAITTSQFKITYTVSGTFTATGNGFTANPTAIASYLVENGWCKLTIPAGALTGTSNATTFTVTGLPSAITPQSSKNVLAGTYEDNTTYGTPLQVSMSPSVGTLTLGKNAPFGGSWTASGTKALISSEFVYSLS